MRLSKQELWARSGQQRPARTPDEKYRKKAKKRLFAGKKNRPCAYCGKPLSFKRATLDHMTPQSKGGKNVGNLTLACRPCNQRKGALDAQQFRAVMDGSHGDTRRS